MPTVRVEGVKECELVDFAADAKELREACPLQAEELLPEPELVAPLLEVGELPAEGREPRFALGGPHAVRAGPLPREGRREVPRALGEAPHVRHELPLEARLERAQAVGDGLGLRRELAPRRPQVVPQIHLVLVDESIREVLFQHPAREAPCETRGNSNKRDESFSKQIQRD